MSTFRFRAARTDGAAVRGVLEAASVDAAAAALSSRGLLPVAIRLADERTRRPRRVNGRAVASAIESLATLVNAGVPLAQALDATQAVAPQALRDPLARVATRVRQGASLGGAMAEEEASFSGLTVGLVRAGERGVGLGPALLQAAAQLERQAEAAAQVQAALAYPLLLGIVGTVSVSLIVLFVVPRFAAILGDLGQALPPATRALIWLAQAARHYGLVMAALAIALVSVAGDARRRHLAAWHAALLRIPALGSLRHGFATARVTRTLGALLATGTPALVALAIARDAAADQAVADRLAEARDRVAEGASLASALRAAGALTQTAVQLAAIGEQSGRLPALLAKAAELEDQTAQRRLETLVRLLEPALIIAFAAGVAFVAAALLQAVYAVRPT